VDCVKLCGKVAATAFLDCEVEAQMIASRLLVIGRIGRAARPKAGDGISLPAAWS
jgi:hypothetical protein